MRVAAAHARTVLNASEWALYELSHSCAVEEMSPARLRHKVRSARRLLLALQQRCANIQPRSESTHLHADASTGVEIDFAETSTQMRAQTSAMALVFSNSSHSRQNPQGVMGRHLRATSKESVRQSRLHCKVVLMTGALARLEQTLEQAQRAIEALSPDPQPWKVRPYQPCKGRQLPAANDAFHGSHGATPDTAALQNDSEWHPLAS